MECRVILFHRPGRAGYTPQAKKAFGEYVTAVIYSASALEFCGKSYHCAYGSGCR